MAGLKLANKSSSFLIFNRPLSGRILKSKSSHFGPPTAPNKIASDFFAVNKVFSVIGIPYSSIEAPPINSVDISKLKCE